MKQLVFIDNDFEENVQGGLHFFLRKFDRISGEEIKKLIEEIKIIPEFSRLSKEEKLEILFNKNNIIATFSVYTDDSFNQLFKFLAAAGSSWIKD